MAEDKKPIGWVEDAQIDAWKAKHECQHIEEVFTTDSKGEEHVSYLRPSGINELEILGTHTKKGQEIKGAKVLFNTLYLGGSEIVKKDPSLFKSAVMTSIPLHKSVQGRLGKR